MKRVGTTTRSGALRRWRTSHAHTLTFLLLLGSAATVPGVEGQGPVAGHKRQPECVNPEPDPPPPPPVIVDLPAVTAGSSWKLTASGPTFGRMLLKAIYGTVLHVIPAPPGGVNRDPEDCDPPDPT